MTDKRRIALGGENPAPDDNMYPGNSLTTVTTDGVVSHHQMADTRPALTGLVFSPEPENPGYYFGG